nr:unnamed protein product [Digitaria exilis]
MAEDDMVTVPLLTSHKEAKPRRRRRAFDGQLLLTEARGLVAVATRRRRKQLVLLLPPASSPCTLPPDTWAWYRYRPTKTPVISVWALNCASPARLSLLTMLADHSLGRKKMLVDRGPGVHTVGGRWRATVNLAAFSCFTLG